MTSMDKLRQWMYYLIIAIISLISLTFLPMIGSSVGLGWNLPNTFVGWFVWVLVKLIVATLNVLIFHCFMLQAKLNVKDNKKYVESKQLLAQLQLTNNSGGGNKTDVPRAPKEWTVQQYKHKGITVFGTTALSTIALTQAILTFDWMSMLTYLFTIIMGLIFGVMQMKTAEDYWTEEFVEYVQLQKLKSEETNNNYD